MINLLDNKDFNMEVNLKLDGTLKDFIGELNFTKTLRNKLSIAAEKGELINTQGLRGIGKTYELARFAKENGYAIISPNADYVKESTGYDLVYPNLNRIRGFKLKGLVFDEGISLVDIQEFKDDGFNVVTGYYTETKKSESFSGNMIDTLKTEIECLTPKIQKTRENHDFGTYKNLILAYKEVLQLLNYVQLNYK